MFIIAKITISHELPDLNQANDWIEDVKAFLKDKVPGTFRSSTSNRNPPLELIRDEDPE